jgi:hypothetical protein
MRAYRNIPSSRAADRGAILFQSSTTHSRTFPRVVDLRNVKQKKPAACGKGPIALRKQTLEFPPFGEKVAVKALT